MAVKNNIIDKKRISINKIDRQILLLLSKRFEVVSEIKKVKKELKINMYDKKRESEILRESKKSIVNQRNKNKILQIYKNILLQSLNYLLEKRM